MAAWQSTSGPQAMWGQARRCRMPALTPLHASSMQLSYPAPTRLIGDRGVRYPRRSLCACRGISLATHGNTLGSPLNVS